MIGCLQIIRTNFPHLQQSFSLISLSLSSNVKAVGKTINVKHGKEKEIKSIQIKERPTQCALCTCHKAAGKQPMHPLYDKSGPHGQPLLGKENTLLWVHTLCALFIGGCEASAGCVYGCDDEGRFEIGSDKGSDDESDDSNDNDDENSQSQQMIFGYNYFQYHENGKEVLSASPHHFVITSKVDNAPEATLSFMNDSRNLKCQHCKVQDVHLRSKRIAIQVSVSGT